MKTALLLGLSYGMAYPVLRLARAAGWQVHVLGQFTARGLRYSSACASYRDFEHVPGEAPIEASMSEIKSWCRQLNAERIIPTDIVSTRFLAGNRCSPNEVSSLLPSLGAFDLLNDKWRFYCDCAKNGIATPVTALAGSFEAIVEICTWPAFQFPVVIKPVLGMGGAGVHVIRNARQLHALKTRIHRPHVVQKYIAGTDRDISVLCAKGKSLAWAVQRRSAEGFDFSPSHRLEELVRGLIARMSLSGIVHFDAVEDAESKEIYLVECNPRFWSSIYGLAAAGLNMVDLWLKYSSDDSVKEISIDGGSVSKGKALIGQALRLRMAEHDRRMAAYYCADPIGVLARHLAPFKDSHERVGGIDHQVALLSKLMAKQPGP